MLHIALYALILYWIFKPRQRYPHYYPRVRRTPMEPMGCFIILVVLAVMFVIHVFFHFMYALGKLSIWF